MKRFSRATRIPGRLASGLAAAAAVVALAGCSPAVDVQPAIDAADPACADVMVRLPTEMGDAALRDTTSQATAAWGDPSTVVLRCGLTPSGPTTTPCVSVNDVDWLSVDEGEHWRFTTFGRKPAVEVLISTKATSGQSVLNSLTGAVATLPKTDKCIDSEDADAVPTLN